VLVRRIVSWLAVRPWLALAVTWAALVVLFVVGQSDLVAADPLWYATNAHDLAYRASDLFALHDDHPFVMRLGLTAPVAVMYRVFGVSTLVTNLPMLAAQLGIVAIAYAAAPTARGKWLAVLFTATSTVMLRDNMLGVDLPCGAVMAWSVLLLARGHRKAAIVVWFAAFQIKETAVWLAPVWIYSIWRAVRELGPRAVAIGGALAIAYIAACALLWGDPLARFHGIAKLTHEHSWAMDEHPIGDWIARLVWEPPRLLWRMFGVVLAPAIVGAVVVRGRERVWCVAALSIVGLFWFGSSSPIAYAPLPLIDRMAYPAIPELAILAALGVDAVLDRCRGARVRAAIVLAIVAVVARREIKTIADLCARDQPEAKAYAWLRDDVAAGRDVVLVCGDPRCPAITGYYFEFDVPRNLTVVTLDDFAKSTPTPGARAVVRAIVNRGRGFSGDAARRFASLPVIVERGDVSLYDAGDGAALRR
jgi:hypothetical protein